MRCSSLCLAFQKRSEPIRLTPNIRGPHRNSAVGSISNRLPSINPATQTQTTWTKPVFVNYGSPLPEPDTANDYTIINGERAVRADNQGQIFNTRLTFAPYFADGGRHLLHVGGHYSYISAPSGHQTISTYLGGNSFFGYLPLTTGQNDVRHHQRGGLELAYQSGPLRAQVEAFAADFGRAGTATGTSMEMTYFLTGEHRAYSLATAVFGGPAKVNRPFHPFQNGDWNLVDGMGA